MPPRSAVERLAGEGQEGLAERLVLSGVGVDVGGDVLGVRIPSDDELRLADELADAGADHVHADDGAVVDADRLDHARGAEDARLAVAGQVVLERGDVLGAVLLGGLRLGEADGGHLRVGVGDLGDVDVVDRDGREAREGLGDEDALLVAAVRELQARDDVADGVDAGNRGLELLVDAHEAAIELHADLLEAEVRGHRAAADRDEQQIRLDRLAVLERDDDAGVVLGDAGETHAELELDSATAEGTLEVLRDRLVLVGDEVGERLDDRDLGAPALPHARELHADHAAAEHGDLLRHEVEREGLLGGDDASADLETGKRARVGTGREHDVRAADGLVADLHGVRRGETPLALDGGDTAALEKTLQALPLAGDDPLAVGRHGGDVDAPELRRDAVLGGVARDVRHLGGVQERLRRDAADVQARAPDLVLFDEGDGLAELGVAERGGVPAASRTQDDEVEGLLGHRRNSLALH